MNKLFVDDLIERLEYGFDNVLEHTQDEVKRILIDTKESSFFPMVSYEHTDDSNFDVDISESKFLNDPAHKGTWIVGMNDDELIFLLNLKKKNGSILEIDTLEIRDELKGQGIGSNIVSVIESVAEQYYDCICVSPFDTDAINFWEHMEYYKEENYPNWVKGL